MEARMKNQDYQVREGRLWTAALVGLLALCLPPPVGAEKPGSAIYGTVSLYDSHHHPLKDRSNVVVYIEEVQGNQGFTPPAELPVVASRDMKFVPSVLPVLVGTTVKFTNDDDMQHNVFSLSETKPFDLGLFKKGETPTQTFDTPGLVKIFCNIHQAMIGYILVLGNPYHTLTDAQGKYSIPDVPPGTYKLVSWYRYGDSAEKDVFLTKTQPVQVDGNSASGVEVDFDLVKTHDDFQHKNKWGQGYNAKY
jgi:plastocyanin